MTNTSTTKAMLDPIRSKIERIIKSLTSSEDPFVEALRSFLTALDYNDEPLMRSRLEEIRDSFCDEVTKGIEKQLGWAQSAFDDMQILVDTVKRKPHELGEEFDRLGRSINNLLEEAIDFLKKYYENINRISAILIPNVVHLKREIEKWSALKDNTANEWPWSYRELPPVNRKMVQDSRDAFKRGEGRNLKEVIRELSGDVTAE